MAARFLSAARREAVAAPESGIVEVFNYGRNKQGLMPLWVGEGDLPTSDFITKAATNALEGGETFYTAQRGHPDYREAIARMMTRVYGSPFEANASAFEPGRFFATIGGMHALQLAVRIAAGAGDEALVLTPAWPNFAGALLTAGARPVEVPLDFKRTTDGYRWALDLDRLARAVTPATRAIVVNTPGNPTGWTASREELQAILDLARTHGLWIVADEIYGRFYYAGERAPSFHDIMAPDDLVLFANTMSKNWAMTGWRIGWLEAPAALGQQIENLIQYSTSGVPQFVQRGAIAALDHGEDFVAFQRARAAASRAVLVKTLGASRRVRFAAPEGGFYLFLSIDEQRDTRKLAFRLVDEAGVGLAPGTTFGEGGAPFMRLCFARSPDDIGEAARRIAAWLAT
ncbi:MAG: pyridoxal phosphate-dependent aminotransferase [Hyphomicrobiales bacterium]|nr:pyridoxal phosphate-dependent aminotransferase [Hyphomicrobiales bacterium]